MARGEGGGRPKKQIDARQVEAMAASNLSGDEIAVILGVSRNTILRRFGAALLKGRERCRASLKRRMYQLAMGEYQEDDKGKLVRAIVPANTSIMIFLSKQMCGYSDKVEMKMPREKEVYEDPGDVKEDELPKD